MSRMPKYSYTEDEFPTNTGSLTRPARFNLRLTCQARARTHAVLSKFRKIFAMPGGTNYADVWESKALPTLEHVIRKVEQGDSATRAFFKTVMNELFKAGVAMRDAQSLFFKLRDQNTLEKSKVAEARFDRAVQACRDLKKPVQQTML